MKIVFDNIIYSLQKSGGGSVYWTELMKRFNNRQQDEITFYDQKEPINNIFRKTIEFRNLKIEHFLTLPIRRYLNFTKPITEKSIFHSSYFRISKSKNAINITTIHDFTTEKFRRGLARWVNLQQKKHAVKNSKGIICISENTKKDLLEFIPEIKGKITVIYNGVSDDFFPFGNSFNIKDINRDFAGLENGKFLLYIGHRTAYKNFDTAVKATAKLKNKYKLAVVGEPFNEAEKKLVEKFLGGNCVQISKLNNEGLNYLYNSAFALLYPSSYEGFGIPLVEAMKTGCPVIAAHNSSIPEVAGDAAILYDNITADKIMQGVEMLENSDYRENLVEKGYLQSKKFDWDKTFEEYLQFYKEIYNHE